MSVFLCYVLPLGIIATGSIAGYFVCSYRDRASDMVRMIFVVCHILLLFFPLILLKAGEIWETVAVAGKCLLYLSVKNFSAAFLNSGLSMVAMWTFVWMFSAMVITKKRFLH